MASKTLQATDVFVSKNKFTTFCNYKYIIKYLSYRFGCIRYDIPLREDDVDCAEQQRDGGADVYCVMVALEDVGEGAAQQQPDEIGAGAGHEKQSGYGEEVCETG